MYRKLGALQKTAPNIDKTPSDIQNTTLLELKFLLLNSVSRFFEILCKRETNLKLWIETFAELFHGKIKYFFLLKLEMSRNWFNKNNVF